MRFKNYYYYFIWDMKYKDIAKLNVREGTIKSDYLGQRKVI